MDKYAHTLMQSLEEAKGKLLLLAAPDGFSVTRIVAEHYGMKGPTVYKADGVPFFEMHEPEISIETRDGKVLATCTVKYRKL